MNIAICLLVWCKSTYFGFVRDNGKCRHFTIYIAQYRCFTNKANCMLAAILNTKLKIKINIQNGFLWKYILAFL